MSDPAVGRFVWHDLVSADLEASFRFYSQLFDWGVAEREVGPSSPYTVILAGDRPIGGIVPLADGLAPNNRWVSYLWVDDVDALAARMIDLGGRVNIPPTEIPEVGRFAMLADPTGAVLAPFHGTASPPNEPDGEPGTFCWTELLTTDTEAAAAFYRAICGWTPREIDMGQLGAYTIFMRGSEDAAGMMQLPADAQDPSSWLVYVAVEDVDEAAALAEQLEGKIFVKPTDIPTVGRVAVAADPQGSMFAMVALELEAA